MLRAAAADDDDAVDANLASLTLSAVDYTNVSYPMLISSPRGWVRNVVVSVSVCLYVCVPVLSHV